MTQASGTPGPPQGEPATNHTDGVTGGRIVAWAGFVFGSLTSVAGNWLAAWIPPAAAGPAWSPSVAGQFGAGVWPVALLLSVEVLARVRWPAGWGWAIARYVGVVSVALGSAIISYGHIHTLLGSWGYDWRGALVGPLVLDGLMVVSGFALLADHHRDTGDTPVDHPVASPVISDDDELRARARWLFTTDPEIGRYKLRDALNIGRSGDPVTENQARKILTELKDEARPQLEAVADGG